MSKVKGLKFLPLWQLLLLISSWSLKAMKSAYIFETVSARIHKLSCFIVASKTKIRLHMCASDYMTGIKSIFKPLPPQARLQLKISTFHSCTLYIPFPRLLYFTVSSYRYKLTVQDTKAILVHLLTESEEALLPLVSLW